MRLWTFLTLGIVFLCRAVWAGESVLYSITDKSITVLATNRASRMGSPVAESRTDVFAFDPETGKKRLVFSDANADFLISGERGDIIVGGKKMFAFAVDRQSYANQSGPGALYELSTDGSNKLRKVFDIERGATGSNFRTVFANASGSKIGNINIIGGKTDLSLPGGGGGKHAR